MVGHGHNHKRGWSTTKRGRATTKRGRATAWRWCPCNSTGGSPVGGALGCIGSLLAGDNHAVGDLGSYGGLG